MHRVKQIAVILHDTLRHIGVHSILTTYFPPVEVTHYYSFEELVETGSDLVDYYFIQPETFVLNTDFFLPRKNKVIILVKEKGKQQTPSYSNMLIMDASQEIIIEQLQQVFSTDTGSMQGEGNKDLSVREIEVLQLVVKGAINKEIADKLSISLNTVLSHRKNITAKLGIKTVSGLTFYSIMNGYISADDIEL